METLASSAEITGLQIDLPVYMLQHMTRPSDSILEELVHFLDERMGLVEDPDIHWDLRMGNALAVLCVAQHPNAVDLCGEIYAWVEDASPYLQQKIFRLIECALDAAVHHPSARRWLRSITKGHPLHFPLTLLAVKNGHLDEELQKSVLAYWEEDPAAGSTLMGASKDDVFRGLIERELTWLAPFVRYLPPQEHAPRILEHELWVLLGEAWFNINYQGRPTPPWLNPTFVVTGVSEMNELLARQQEWHEHLDMHLMELFGRELPWTQAEWIKALDQSPESERWKNRLLEVSPQQVKGSFPLKRTLQLVPHPE